MQKCLIAAALITGLAACSTDYSEDAHTVEEYLADDELSAKTIEACSAGNIAERRIMREKEACKNLGIAESLKFNAAFAASSPEEREAYIQEQLEELRAERAREKQPQ